MGSDQSSTRRTERQDSFTYSQPYTISSNTYEAAPASPPPVRQQSQPPRIQPRVIQQTTTVSQSRIYPTLDQPATNTTLEFYQRHSQPAHQQHTPSAPPEAVVNNNIPTSSTTKQRKQDNTTNCQTCEQPYGIRIFQCLGGHSCCENCKSLLKSCRSCGQRIGDMRNFALEEWLADIKVPCLNKNEGCSLTFKRIEMDNHMTECPFSERPCPLQMLHIMSCQWKGKQSNLSAHFDLVHPDHRKIEVGNELIIKNISAFININHHFIHLITIGAFHFLFHIAINKNDKISMTVQFCGTNVSASKWIYEFHVYNKQEPRKKFLYTDICQSYPMPLDEIFKTAAVLPMVYAKGFFNSDSFTYKVFIKKNGPYRNENIRPTRRGIGNRGSRSSSVNRNT